MFRSKLKEDENMNDLSFISLTPTEDNKIRRKYSESYYEDLELEKELDNAFFINGITNLHKTQ